MKPGDRIQTTQYWLTYNYTKVKPYTGVFVKTLLGKYKHLIKVQRDGIKHTEVWRKDFWEPIKET